MKYKITKALIGKARAAAIEFLNQKKLSARERAALIGGVTMAAQRLFEVREESKGEISFTSIGSLKTLMLDGARDFEQLATGGGALFLWTGDLLELFCTEEDALKYRQWAAGEGRDVFPLIGGVRDLNAFYGLWLENGAAYLYTALKTLQGYKPRHSA